jgi:chorismate synthase
MLSIPSAKGCEIGDGFAGARSRGSAVHDPIVREPSSFVRPTNRAGGIEGGMTNGEPVVVRVALKPLSTLKDPLPTVDLRGGDAVAPDPQRSDVCAVPAGAVVAESMLAIVLADALRERFGGPTLDDLKAGVAAELQARRERFFPGTSPHAGS